MLLVSGCLKTEFPEKSIGELELESTKPPIKTQVPSTQLAGTTRGDEAKITHIAVESVFKEMENYEKPFVPGYAITSHIYGAFNEWELASFVYRNVNETLRLTLSFVCQNATYVSITPYSEKNLDKDSITVGILGYYNISEHVKKTYDFSAYIRNPEEYEKQYGSYPTYGVAPTLIAKTIVVPEYHPCGVIGFTTYIPISGETLRKIWEADWYDVGVILKLKDGRTFETLAHHSIQFRIHEQKLRELSNYMQEEQRKAKEALNKKEGFTEGRL